MKSKTKKNPQNPKIMLISKPEIWTLLSLYPPSFSHPTSI